MDRCYQQGGVSTTRMRVGLIEIPWWLPRLSGAPSTNDRRRSLTHLRQDCRRHLWFPPHGKKTPRGGTREHEAPPYPHLWLKVAMHSRRTPKEEQQQLAPGGLWGLRWGSLSL